MSDDYGRDIFQDTGKVNKPETVPNPKMLPMPNKSKPKSAPDSRNVGTQLERLITAREDGYKIVAVIGFADSGKTFYINRLRHDLPKYANWQCNPTYEQGDIVPTSKGVYGTRVTQHRRRQTHYLLADVAGETFSRAFEKLSAVRDLGPIELDKISLSVIALADAYMLLIPSKNLHLGKDTKKADPDNKAMMESFHHIIGLIKVAHDRKVTVNTVRDFIVEGVTGQEMQAAFKDHRITTSKPISVLFSQADLYAKNSAANFDEDPFLFTFEHFPRLANRINEFFDYYRFDFLSAFANLPENYSTPKYELPSYGALESFYWTHQYLASQDSRLGKLTRLMKGYLTTRRSIQLRKFLDGGFKKHCQELKI